MTFNPSMPMSPFFPQPAGGTRTPAEWEAYLQEKFAVLREAYQKASGFEIRKLESEIDNAKKARENAIELQQMRDRASRYGVDQQTMVSLKQLEQNAAQFEKQHALDTRKADIDEAQLLSSMRNEPDQMFQAMDVEQALSSIRAGRPAQQLATMPGGTGTGVAAIDRAVPASGGAAVPATSGATYSTQPAAGGTRADPRVKILKSIVDGLPPSETEGFDPTAVAALNAAFELYKAPLRPGTMETLSPTQQAGLKSASKIIQSSTGRSYDDLLADYDRYKPRQSSVRYA